IDLYVVDVTARKAAQVELEEALYEHKNVLDTIPDLIFSLDLNGGLENWNRRFEEVTGYDGAMIAESAVLNLFRDDDRPRVAQALLDCLERGVADVECDL